MAHRLRRPDGRRRQDVASEVRLDRRVRLPRYEAGERLVGGNWITAEADAARHSDMKNGWQVRTDHFLVTTNHSLEAAAELAARLERLHQVWRQLFAGFYLTESEVRRLVRRRARAAHATRPFRVYYHRDRDEYTAALRRRQPRIAETLGIYFDADREAHFFAGDDQDAGTLYHEAVHQLFQESRPAAKQVGRTRQFLDHRRRGHVFRNAHRTQRPRGGSVLHGRRIDGRPAARGARAAAGTAFTCRWPNCTRLGKTDVQQHPDIAKLYSQSAGLAAFLMDGERGRYREPLVRYLKAVYAGRDNDQSLAEATGHSYDELDAAYRRYMESLP